MWCLAYSRRAERQLSKLDPSVSRIIVAWMAKNVDGCENPRAHGKGLLGNHSSEWRYRIGDYRVLCEIRDEELIVLAIEVGHRGKVYR